MLPWMSVRSRVVAIAPSPLEGARRRHVGPRQLVPKVAELLLEKVRVHVRIVRNEVSEGRLHRDRSPNVPDRHSVFIAKVHIGLDVALAHILSELVRCVRGGTLKTI